jgi:hypothetical protein
MAPAAPVTEPLTSLNVGADRRLSPDARALSDASERTAAAATVVDLVKADLRLIQASHELRLEDYAPELSQSVAELHEIRATLHDIAGRLRQAAARADGR